MSGKCEKCLVVFSSGDVVATCSDCKLSFHPSCTRERNFTKSKSKYWKCDSCKEETGSVKSNEDSEDRKSILEALKIMKNDINSNTDKKISSLQVSVDLLSEQISNLNKKIDVLDENQKKLELRCDSLEQTNQHQKEELRSLRLQLLDVEQHSRANNLEVVGLPYTQKEDIYTCLEQLAGAIDVPFCRSDVSIAHRLHLYSKKHMYPPIIIQFVSRSIRERWLIAARRNKHLNAKEVSPSLADSPVYVNQHLTSHNKGVLGRARRLMKAKKIHFAGFFNGKILIKPKEGDTSIRVAMMEDLDKYDR